MASSLLDLDRDSLIAVVQRITSATPGFAAADLAALGATCKALRAVTDDDLFWRALSIQKWGPRVEELRAELLASRRQAVAEADAAAADAAAEREQAGPGPQQQQQPLASTSSSSSSSSWRAYATRRMSARSIAPSPLRLLQERYPDPWQHILCCVLCSRTSGSDVISSTVARFFEAFPTPSAVLDAGDAEVIELIHPLGLQDVRLRAVRSVSRGFLATDWEDPTAFYGCGRFVADSWRIFTQGDLSGAGVEDRNLKAYLSWARRQRERQLQNGDGEGVLEDEEEKDAEAEEEEKRRRQQQQRKRREEADAASSERALRAARRAKQPAATGAAGAATPDAPSRRTRGALAAAAEASGGGKKRVGGADQDKKRRAAPPASSSAPPRARRRV